LLDAMMKVVGLVGARPVLIDYNRTTYGNTVTIPNTLAGTGRQTPLLRADIRQAHAGKAFEAGAWVVTLRTDPVYTAGGYNPLIAVVSVGDGAIAQTLEVDIGRGTSFQVPCGAVQIDARLDAAIAPNVVPSTQTILCSVHRGFSSVRPKRSFYQLVTAGAGVATVIPIPNQADRMRVWGTESQLGTSTYLFVGGGGVFLGGFTGAEVKTAMLASGGVPVPSGAFAVGWATLHGVPGVQILEFDIAI
jgi:hypothetical protein